MKISPRQRSGIVALCTIVTVAALARILYSCRSSPPTFDRDRAQTDGEMAAAAVVRFLGEGRRVLIVAPEFDALPAYRAQVSAFKSALKANGARVVGLETVPADESGSRFPLWGRGVSGREVLARAAARPETEAVVVLLHVPVFTPDVISETAGRRPPIVLALVDGFQTGVKELVEQGIVSMALVSGLPAQSAAMPATPKEQFERRYLEVTKDNVARLKWH